MEKHLRIRELTISETKKIYEDCLKADFPPSERKPFTVIRRGMERGSYRSFGSYLEDGAFAGYAILVFQGAESEYCLLDYFAVSPSLRGQGVGSLFLRELARRMPSCSGLLIETEDPAYAEDEESREIMNRRILFYERNGAVMTDVGTRLFGVEYRIMVLPGGLRKERGKVLREEVETLYRSMYSAVRYRLYER